jgi:serine/threonine-protein kinase NIM1
VVKIGDFGFSTFAQSGQLLNTFCGSPPYAAPELFKDEQYEGRFVDVWALGILLFFIATGLMPFRADTVSKLKKLILEGVYVIPPYVTPPCAALIRGLLQLVPADRLTLAHITKSAWLGGEDFPQPLPKYQLNPTVDSLGSGGLGGLTGDEATARIRLNELGISDSLLRQSASKEARSSIIGTYRIMLHRVQRERDGYVDGLPDEPTSSANDGTGRKASVTKRRQINLTPTTNGKGQPQKPSKLCTLL